MHPHPAKVSSKMIDKVLVSIMLRLSLFDSFGVCEQPVSLLFHLLHRLVVTTFCISACGNSQGCQHYC